MLRKVLVPMLLTLVAVSAEAHDDRSRVALGAGLGAAVGAAIGSELGGRNEAILGSAIGGAVGAAIATEDRPTSYRRHRQPVRYDYRHDRRYDYLERGHRHKRKHRGPRFCPPGLARQGRCWR